MSALYLLVACMPI